MADGSIRIDTRLNNNKLGGDLNQLKQQINSTVKQLERDVTSAGKSVESLTKKFNDVNQELAETYAKMDEIANAKMEFAGVGNVSGEELLDADANYQKLVQKADQLTIESEEYKNKISEAKIEQSALNQELTNAKEEQTEINDKIEDAKNRTELLKGSTESVSKSLSKGIKRLLVYAGALLSIRSVYNLLRSAMNEWLNGNSAGARQLKADIAYMRYAIGNALSPVLKWVVNTLYKILGLVGAIIQVFTGKNIFAGAVESFENMASSAGATTKELKKQLAGFDSINKLDSQKDSGSGGGGGGGALPSQDLSELSNKYLDKAKELKWILEEIAIVLGALALTKLLSDLNVLKGNAVWQFLMGIIALGTAVKLEFDFISKVNDGDLSTKTLLEGALTSILGGGGATLVAHAFGAGWALSLKIGLIITFALAAINMGISIGEWIKQNYGSSIDWYIDKFNLNINEDNLAEEIFKIIGIVLATIGDVLIDLVDKAVGDTIRKCFNYMKSGTEGDAISFAEWFIWTIINGLTLNIPNLVAVIMGIPERLTVAWEWIKSFFTMLWEWIVWSVTDNFNRAKNFFTGFYEWIVNSITTNFNIAKTVLSTVWEWIVWSVTDNLNRAKNFFTGFWNWLIGQFQGWYSNISQFGSTIANFFSQLWGNVKNTTSNVWNGIWGNIRSVCNSILGGVEGMVNGVIRGFNKMITSLNRLKINIPSWVPSLGGKSLGFNINSMSTVSLPRLAKGGIVMQPTQAIIGEAGREAVLPLQNNTEWMDILAEKISSKVNITSDGGTYRFIAQLDGDTLFDKVFSKKKENDFATNGGAL